MRLQEYKQAKMTVKGNIRTKILWYLFTVHYWTEAYFSENDNPTAKLLIVVEMRPQFINQSVLDVD